MAEFFLNDNYFQALCKAYANAGNPASNERKGIVILVNGNTCRIVGVKGIIRANGRIDEIASSGKGPCPYPPPCLKDAAGNCLTDENGNFILDESNPNATDYL